MREQFRNMNEQIQPSEQLLQATRQRMAATRPRKWIPRMQRLTVAAACTLLIFAGAHCAGAGAGSQFGPQHESSH